MTQAARRRKIPKEETPRRYTVEDIQRFLEEDKLDPQTAARVRELVHKGRL